MSIFDEYKGFWGTGAELTERAKFLSKSMGVKAEKVTERLIRYYTAEGVLDKPDRLGRDAAYHFRHLIQLLTARRLADEGVPLAVISDFNLNKSTEELAEALLKPPKEEAVAISEQYRGKLMESKEKEKPNLDSDPIALEDVLNEIKNIRQALSNEAVQLQKMKYEIEERPWGTYEVLLDAENVKVKRIIVNPNQRLSYQYHHKRREQCTVVEGELTVVLNDIDFQRLPGETVYISLGDHHRAWNQTNLPVTFIEVQTGTYFGEDDIVRIEDDYNRG